MWISGRDGIREGKEGEGIDILVPIPEILHVPIWSPSFLELIEGRELGSSNNNKRSLNNWFIFSFRT